ncbi:unnamed protein product [Notodromas monacha]|uniref:Uncharacterized protein n=1 Tax=Notodromas monacha TaxID=399045 RepID=A0A7R9BT67_9CRUS|nr:unnamed protein product [Notodromas monacha]CAG0920218.1 unnamed protein product [Notodromas monacha]
MLRCVVICAVLFCCVLVKAATFSGSYIKYAAPRFAIQPQYVSTGPAVPGGPLVRIPGTFGGRKDYAPAHYVSQFAKVFDRMRRSGRSTQESFVAAKSDLRARGLAPWVWQDGKLRRVESPALSANSVSEVPREKVVSYQRTPAALQPAPPVFEDFSYVQHLGQDNKDVALVFSEYSKFIDENLRIGHDEAFLVTLQDGETSSCAEVGGRMACEDICEVRRPALHKFQVDFVGDSLDLDCIRYKGLKEVRLFNRTFCSGKALGMEEIRESEAENQMEEAPQSVLNPLFEELEMTEAPSLATVRPLMSSFSPIRSPVRGRVARQVDLASPLCLGVGEDSF